MTHDFEDNFFQSNETYIHSTAIVGKQVNLDYGAKIGPFAVIAGNVSIGKNTKIYPHVSIGFPAEDVNTKQPQGSVVIGENCEIREFATVGASKYSQGTTRIGNNVYIMHYCHIAHDVTLEDHVVLINNVQLGGHTHVEHHAFLMANSATHQGTRIGQYTALAPFSGIRQDIPPFCIMNGQPAAFAGLNLVGLRRAGFSTQTIQGIKKVSTLFFQQKIDPEIILKTIHADQELAENNAVLQFITFIQQSQRGVSRRSAINQNTTQHHQERSSIC